MSADPRPSHRRGGRLWALLMTAVAIAALREAAFARNRSTTPRPPDRPTPPPADAAPPGATA